MKVRICCRNYTQADNLPDEKSFMIRKERPIPDTGHLEDAKRNEHIQER
jgi:hypothetical protein